jgi:integrase
MATGIVKRHSAGCTSRQGAHCNCKAGYQAWIYLERENKKVYKSFGRAEDAKAWRAETLLAAHRGTLQLASHDPRSLAFALRHFLEDMRAGKVRPKKRVRYKPSTVRGYDQHVRRRISPAPLGSMKVAEIRRPDVQDFVDELLGQGLSTSTVKNVLNPIQTFYRRAKDREELVHNPTERIDIPLAGSKRPKRIATREEAARLISALPLADQAIWATAFYAGLRRGELQAIRRCDINLATCLVSVKRGWDQYEGVIDAKSDAGERELPLLALLRDILDEYLLRTGRKDDDLLFGRTAKEAFVASTVRNRAHEAWKAAGLRPITLHECRHTFASLLIDSGANPKAIQEFMGHSNIQTTFDIYGHLLPGSHEEARSRMDSYLAIESQSLVHRHGLTGAPLVHEPIWEDQSPENPDHRGARKRLQQASSTKNAPFGNGAKKIPLRGFEPRFLA